MVGSLRGRVIELLVHDIQASCAVTGEGLQDGLEWVGQRVKPDAS